MEVPEAEDLRAMLFYLLLGGLALIAVGLVLIYNGLVQKSQMADNGWSDIDVQLKRRANLIPQLVNTVQGYATHERELFADIAEKRAQAMAAGDDLASRGEAESALSRPVARLMPVAEDYPDMKASQNFLDLQTQLEGSENRIAVERRMFNDLAKEFNASIRRFPANIVAGFAGLEKHAYFEADEGAQKAQQVDFGK